MKVVNKRAGLTRVVVFLIMLLLALIFIVPFRLLELIQETYDELVAMWHVAGDDQDDIC